MTRGRRCATWTSGARGSWFAVFETFDRDLGASISADKLGTGIAIPTAGPAARPPRPILALLLLAVLGGAWLRLHALANQIVLDDEYHAIAVALFHSYSDIFSRFFEADNSIPLTAIYKFLMDTVGLSELWLRLPQLAAGILLLLIFPLWVRRIAGWPETLLFGLLAAASPQLIFYSRFARPYAVSTLAAGLAVGAFLLFARTGRRPWLALYIGAGILAVWFHPLSLPFTLAPVPFLAAGRRRFAGTLLGAPGRAAAAGGILLAGAGALLLDPLRRSAGLVAEKAGAGSLSLDSFLKAGWLWSGSSSAWVAGIFWLLAVLGAVLLVRRHRLEGGCLIWCLLVQVAAVAIARPTLVGDFYVLARYSLWALPPVLLFVAVGACGPLRGRWWWLGLWPAVLLGATSPLWDAYRAPNNFTNQQRYQLEFVFPGYSEGRDRKLLEGASPAYPWLAEQPPGTIIVETPWYHFNSAVFYGNLQRWHRKEVRIGILDQKIPGWLPLDDPRLRFRNFLPATDVRELRARGVDYLFVHRSLAKETAALGFRLPEMAAHDLEESTRVWREALGPPIHEDRWVQVYAVGR